MSSTLQCDGATPPCGYYISKRFYFCNKNILPLRKALLPFQYFFECVDSLFAGIQTISFIICPLVEWPRYVPETFCLPANHQRDADNKRYLTLCGARWVPTS